MIMQAMDLMRSYMMFKVFIKKETFNTKEHREQDSPNWMNAVKPWLKQRIKGNDYSLLTNFPSAIAAQIIW